MVKKTATVVLFAALIALAFIQFFYIKRSSEDFAARGEKAAAFAQVYDMESAYRMVLDLHEKWTDKKDYFEALMEHSETDKISMSIEKTVSYAKQKDRNQFLAEMQVLVFLLMHIHEIDSVSWENIL